MLGAATILVSWGHLVLQFTKYLIKFMDCQRLRISHVVSNLLVPLTVRVNYSHGDMAMMDNWDRLVSRILLPHI